MDGRNYSARHGSQQYPEVPLRGMLYIRLWGLVFFLKLYASLCKAHRRIYYIYNVLQREVKRIALRNEGCHCSLPLVSDQFLLGRKRSKKTNYLLKQSICEAFKSECYFSRNTYETLQSTMQGSKLCHWSNFRVHVFQ